MINKFKSIWNKLCLAWHILKDKDILILTNSIFYSTSKNIDILGSLKSPNYVCMENSNGGFDIVYAIPCNTEKKYFTITVSRLKGENAGAIADATINVLNNHIISDMIIGDSENQPKPTEYIPYSI